MPFQCPQQHQLVLAECFFTLSFVSFASLVSDPQKAFEKGHRCCILECPECDLVSVPFPESFNARLFVSFASLKFNPENHF